MQNLLNSMTTNETYFFREDNQLKVFSDYCLPEIIQYKRRIKNNHLRIWSAGCSTGEEPYTLAILMRESCPDFLSWNIDIFATDIDTDVLKKAAEGVYKERSVRFVPPIILRKYFRPNGDNYTLDPGVKQMVQFSHLNLFDRAKTRLLHQVDFLFCRNVLIYFNDASRKVVMANFYDSLNPGGYIYLGHAESVTRISSAFNIKRLGGLIVHQKPLSREV
jgi:chemotaxis protein methyltransferase CheR